MELKNLAERAKNGDSTAWTELFNATKDMVYFTALKLCGNKQNAEDLVQEIYIKAMENISSLRAPEAFVTWLRTIAVNVTRNYLVKASPTIFGSDESDEIMQNAPEVDEDFLPAEYASKRETARIIMRIIDSLPEKQRTTVMLYYYNEVPVAEIAKIMNTSENTVKSRLNYARAEIKRQVEELEKKGTKLHGAGVPFLTLALREAAKDYVLAEETSATIAASLAASASATATAATATATAATATATVATATATAATGIMAKMASLPLVTKIIAGVLGAAIAVGGTAAVVTTVTDGDKPQIAINDDAVTSTIIATDVATTIAADDSDNEYYAETFTTSESDVAIPAEKALLYTFKQNELLLQGYSESYLPHIKMYSDNTFELRANIYYAMLDCEGIWEDTGDGNYTMSVTTPGRSYEFNVAEFNLHYTSDMNYCVVTFYPGDSMGVTLDGATFELVGEKAAPDATTNAGAHEILEEFRLANRTNSDGSISYAYADVIHDGIDELIIMINTADYLNPDGAYYEVFTLKNGEPVCIFKNSTGFTTNSMYNQHLYIENGKAYLMTAAFFERQGSPWYFYEIYSLDTNGNKIAYKGRDASLDFGYTDSTPIDLVRDEYKECLKSAKVLVIPEPDDYAGFCATIGRWYKG